MAIIGMRELQRDPKGVFQRLTDTHEPILITNHGHPVAALYPVDAQRAEELMLATAPEYVASRGEGEAAVAAGRTRSLDDAISEYNSGVGSSEQIEPEDVEVVLEREVARPT